MNQPHLTAADLVRAINRLSKTKRYPYVSSQNKREIVIQDVVLPEGPVSIKRWNPSAGESFSTAQVQTISTEMMDRVAKACVPYYPINIDRVLAGSYSTRSVLEALLAHTPEFYFCYPGRVDSYSGKVKRGHKHIMWCPDEPHAPDVMQEKSTNVTVTETTFQATYDALEMPEVLKDPDLDIEVARQHVRIQIALIVIGQHLGYRTWVARNDRGIIYDGRPLAEMPTVLSSPGSETVIGSAADAARAASLIDCIWFGNHRYMPAVMEIEHSTGITSGLTRMRTLQDTIPSINTRYVIVAADELRHSVLEKANTQQFRTLNTRFFPYSAVNELYALFQRRQPRGISQEFLDSYMEAVVAN